MGVWACAVRVHRSRLGLLLLVRLVRKPERRGPTHARAAVYLVHIIAEGQRTQCVQK